MKLFFKLVICAALALEVFPSYAAAISLPISDEDKLAADSTVMMSNKFTKNWEFTAMLGAQSYQAEYSQFSMNIFQLKDSWCLTGDLSLVKWASPYFGIGAGFTEAGYRGVYSPKDDKTTFAKPGDPWYHGFENRYLVASGSYGNLYAKAAVNLSNLLFGFKANRRFELTAYAGGGIIFPTCKVQYRAKGATFNAGINAQVRVAKHLFVTAAVRGALISDGFNGIGYITSGDKNNLSLDGQAGALVGISYKFGYLNRKNQKSGAVNEYEWVPAVEAYQTSEVVKDMIDTEVKDVEEKKDAEIAVISDKLREDNEIINELREKNAPIVLKGNYWQYISFKIDRTNIVNSEKVNIMAAAEYIKSVPDQKFVINGYADKQTSNPAHNAVLADGRAKAVYDALVNDFDVNPEQLEYHGNGGVDLMYFNDVKCSRCVIITVKK